MKRRITQSIAPAVLSMICLLLAGCPFESDFPLSPPGEAGVDEDLIGTWKTVENTDPEAGTLTISRFSDHEVLIVIEEKGGTKREMLRAFTTHVVKERFLNLQGIEGPYGKRKWMFLNYSIANGTLTYRVVSDLLLKEGAARISTSSELKQFVRENLSNKDLYDKDETILIRAGKQ